MSTMSDSDAKPVRLALIGAGIFANKQHLPILLNLQKQHKCTLVAVYSRSPASAKSLANTIKEKIGLEPKICFGDEGMRSILTDDSIEALDIVLPPQAQVEWVRRALPQGKHCLIEKPVASSPSEADQLVQAYANGSLQGDKGKAVFWGVAENYRFETAFRQSAAFISSHQLGRIITFELVAHMRVTEDNPYTQTKWRRDPSHLGGWLLDGGVHFIAALRLLMGNSPVSTATGIGATISPFLYDDEQKSTPDSVFGAVRFENGATGTVSITPGAEDMRFELRVMGTKATICVRRCDGGYETVTTPVGSSKSKVQKYGYNGCDAEIEAFLGVIRGTASEHDRAMLSPSLARDDVRLICSLLGL